MEPLLLPFATYAMVTTFTPGPNNITASATGMRLGYRRTLPFLLGMLAGFILIMLASGLLTDLARRAYEGILPWLKWVGVAYMTWLAVSLFLPSKHDAENAPPRSARFIDGMLLQMVNPKLILYGITIYSSFQTLIAGTPGRLAASVALLSLLGFSSISLWAVVGSTFSRLLKTKTAKLVFNLVMAALLLYSAVAIVLH